MSSCCRMLKSLHKQFASKPNMTLILPGQQILESQSECMLYLVFTCVMLLKLKDDNTTGTFYLCNLFYILSMLTLSIDICIKVYLYTATRCTYDTIVDMYCLNHWLLFVHFVIAWAYLTYNIHICWYYVILEMFVSLFLFYIITTSSFL